MPTMILMPALAMAASMIGAPAAPDTPEAQLVTYADLNLHSAHGQERLEQRIRSAADRLCREDETASPAGGYLNEACFRAALTDAARQMQLAITRPAEKIASAQPSMGASGR